MEKASFPEQWLQAFAKFSLDFFVVELGVHNKVLYSCGKASSYFGYPVESFVEQVEASFDELVLEVDKPRVAKAMQEAKEAKTDMDLQFHLIRFDRSVSLVRISGSYLYSQDDVPTYLFLLSDEKRDIVALEPELETFRLSFSVGTGTLIEVSLQGRIAFQLQDFTDIYEAITLFASRYVHPQDRKAFAVFAEPKSLLASALPRGEQKEILFRRSSYDDLFSGYRWALLSYTLKEKRGGSDLVCELFVQDSDKATSKLAEKTLQTQLDPLTGVLNRSALEAQVNQQVELCSGKDSLGAFFMLDIDQFKWVNDTFGHDRGDEVLRHVARAVKGVFRPTDIVARLGGDEFVVFITGIPSVELAMTKAENICRALRSLTLLDEDLQLSCSVGLSIYPKHGTSFKELYHTSDLALYQAKRKGKDRFCLYGIEAVPYGKEKPVDREWLFSQMEEEIYLCNVDTYALLFVNETLRKRLSLTALTAKGFCYEILHGRDTACEDCKNLCMQRDRISTRLSKDGKTDTIYLLREKSLLLKGSRVKLSISTPIPQAWRGFVLEHLPPDALHAFVERFSEVTYQS